MIITINGTPGSGKSTIARQLAMQLGYTYYSVGQFMRSIAEEKKLSLYELSELAEKDNEIDTLLDNKLKSFNKSDQLVLDARLGYFFIPHSFKIRLIVDVQEAAKRLIKDAVQGKRENEQLKNTQETVEKIKQRIISEQKRYEQYYQTNPESESQYDLVIDTTKKSVNEALEQIKEALA